MARFDPWADAAGAETNTALERLIAERIAAASPIPFAEFMSLALYHPIHGYYASPEPRIGRDGDYITSPEVHPVFGALVARQIAQFWELLGEPARLRVVEPGAGNGTLARDIGRTIARMGVPGVDYVIVEPHPAARARQEWTLRPALRSGLAVRWAERLDQLSPDGATVVVSNELLDAFPVHRVVVREGCLREVVVDHEAGRGFFDREADHSTPALRTAFDRLGLQPGEGCHAEVNLEAPRWIAEAARLVGRGFVLTFDYGAPAAELYAPWRRDGTLLCFYRHVAGQDPYVRIGRQDMTAHVDFTTLVAAGRQAGLKPLGFARQSDALAALGIGERLEAAGEGHLALERYMERQRAVTELLDPAGLGRIHVLAQGKGIGQPALLGFPNTVPDPF